MRRTTGLCVLKRGVCVCVCVLGGWLCAQVHEESVRVQPAGRVASASLVGRKVEKDLEKDEHMLGDSIKNMWVALVLLAAVMVLVANKEAVYQWVLWALGRKKKVKVRFVSHGRSAESRGGLG